MPHGESWFSFLSFYAQVAHAAPGVFGVDGHAFLGGAVGVQHLFGFAFVLLVLTVVGARVHDKVSDTGAALIPEDRFTLRTFVEVFVGAVYGMMLPLLGQKATRFFLPLIGTCAFVIFFSNVLGLIPGFLPPTDNLNTTFACALVIFVTTHIFGVKEHGIAYFKHFLGPIWWLAPLMLPIELISHVVRPVTLAVRLMANMTADHLVLGIFLGLFGTLFIGVLPGVWGGLGALIPVPVVMYFMGCIVVTVQTLVFCLLSTIYISMAIAHEGH